MDDLTIGQPCYVEEPRYSLFGIPMGKVELAGVIETLGPRVAKVRLPGTNELIEVDRRKVKKERLFVGQTCRVQLDRRKYGLDRAIGVIIDFRDLPFGFEAATATCVYVRLSSGEEVLVERTKVKEQRRFE